MIQKTEIQAKLAALESGELAFWEFKEWIEGASFNMHRDSDAAAMDLVGTIGLLFADYDFGVLKEKDLIKKLISLQHSVEFLNQPSNVEIRVKSQPFRLVSGLVSAPRQELGQLLTV